MHANAEPKDKVEGSYVSVTKLQVFYMLNNEDNCYSQKPI